MDVPAKDLALLLRSRHPLILCETVEERRFESLLRGVASELNLPIATWSAASGLSPSHPEDAAKTQDLAVALRQVREARGDGGVELKQFFRTRESLVFTLLFPIMLMVIFGSIFQNTFLSDDPKVSLSQYFVTGMIASGLLATCFQNLAITIPIERDRGVLKRYMGTPMPKWAYFAGKVIAVTVLSVIATVILLIVAVSFYDIKLPDTAAKWGTFAWVMALSLIAFTLLGIAFSSAARTGRSAPAVVTPIALVLQFTSGVFFPYYQLPHWMQQFAAIFPLKWSTQGLRSVFLPDGFAAREVAGSWELGRVALVLGAWCLGGLILCLVTFRWTTKRDG